ncbi:MAG: cysteine desulfurase NifS [Elusimicrobia bacterium]|nr:cysteine desulfurase NifS [Elusimicrobiota bacterium]
MKIIYLDNNATAKVADEVIAEMAPYFGQFYGNTSSMHEFGGQVGRMVGNSRAQVAGLLGAQDPSEIVFTSCGTESDNAALWSAVRAYPEKRHIVTTKVEHPAVLNTCRYMQSQGYSVDYMSVDGEGRLNLDELRDLVTDKTALVSIMHANNETGVIFPVEKAAEIAKSRGALFHTDAVQAVGKIPIDLKNSAIDMLSMSGHKLHSPKGIGALYIKRGTPFVPFMMGGHQEHGRRAGTENTPYIAALGKAAELALKNTSAENTKVKTLRDKLESEIKAKIPNIKINGGLAERLPNTSNISFEFVEGEAILLHLSDKGIAASSGSACTSGSLEPSHVLRAMGVPFGFVHGSIRFSLSVYNTQEEITFVAAQLTAIIDKLRKISHFTPQKTQSCGR